MKLSEMKTIDEVIEDHRQDPEFRAEWDRMGFARQVAIRVLEYRTAHGLSQRALARVVGMAQPAIARLESGEHQPTFDTLAKLTKATGLEFRFAAVKGTVELVAA
jgi:ribosome-binding protein aMBF1 (putative translation factor)